jgi:hypothetical protein
VITRGGATAPSRALVLAATALLVLVALGASEGRPSQPALRVAATGGVIQSTHEGRAVLNVDGIRPGETQSGTVALSNTGDGVQALTLSSGSLSDVAGTGGGPLSRRLELTVERVAPDGAVLFAGALADLTALPAGELAGRGSAVFRFTVHLPEGGPAVDDAYKRATTSVTWRWRADTDGDPSTPASPPASPVEPVDGGWGNADPRGTGGGPVRLWTGGGGRQRIVLGRRRPGFVLLARCAPDCSLQARVTYRYRGRVRALSRRSIGVARWGRTPQRLVFRLRRREIRPLRRALRRGVRATITLWAGAPGHASAVTTRRMKLWR